MNPPKASADFETRSACPIRKTGSWRYSLDPTTEILCLAYRLPYWADGVVALWHPAFPQIDMPASDDTDTFCELLDWIASGDLVEAHNAFFERGIWTNIMVPQYGAPPIAHEQWRCSAAKAAAYALPRALEDAVNALRLSVKKDTEGAKVMKKLSKPRKPRKKEREVWAAERGDAPHPIVYFESKALFERLFTYCQQDVLAEEAVSESLPDLSPAETEMYLLDQAINERGFHLDSDAVATALTLIQQEILILNAEIATVTDGRVKKATQRAQLTKWCQEEHNVVLLDTQAATLDETLTQPDLPAPVRRALEILRTLGRSSTAKYEAMRNWVCPDARVRGGLLYHGASTGRWTGAGIQPHNFPRGKIDDWDMDDAWAVLGTQDRDLIASIYGSVMEPLSQGLRGAITATPGKRLFVADYASIEARVLLWLARELEALEIFRQGGDIYCDMAPSIYGHTITKKDKEKRQLCKIAILGLGYQMGASKFVDTAATYGITITPEFSQQVVNAYREKYWRVKKLWGDQEMAAINAVQWKDEAVECRDIVWLCESGYLFCTLPSGRRLTYPDPELRRREMPWGEKKTGLTFMGVDPLSRKWKRQFTYGGSICIGEGTEVLTSRGWVAIENVGCWDRLWDGDQWVNHGGLLDKGLQRVVLCDGIAMTPDHKVLTTQGWQHASSCSGLDRADVWLPDGVELCGQHGVEVAVADAMRVWDREDARSFGAAARPSSVVRLQESGDVAKTQDTRDVETSGLRSVAVDERSVPTTFASGVEKLWRAGYSRVRQLAIRLRVFLGGYGVDVREGQDPRTTGQPEGVLARQLLLDNVHPANAEQAQFDSGQRSSSRHYCRQPRHIAVDGVLAAQTRVFDLLDCGPANRFVVRNRQQDRCLIVHNCENLVQAIARDLMAEAMLRCETSGTYQPVLSVHDELIAESEAGDVKEFEQLMATCPVWAADCPVACEGFSTERYRK